MMLSLPAALFAMVSMAASFQAAAVESEESQDVVVTVQQDPLENLEASCVAIQIGMSQLAMGSNVTLFPTLGGVGVVNNEVLERLYPDDDSGRPGKGGGNAYGLNNTKWAEPELCVVGKPDGSIVMMPLRDLLDNFAKAGGQILVCPLCWFSRNPETMEDPDLLAELLYESAVIGGPDSIPFLFNDANKVIDF
jgi:predicted peroxiredoxin